MEQPGNTMVTVTNSWNRLTPHLTQYRSLWRRSIHSQSPDWYWQTKQYRNTQSKYNSKSEWHKIQQNKTTLVQSPLTTPSQETRWASEPTQDNKIALTGLSRRLTRLPYRWYSYKASCARPGWAVICNFRHPGTLALRAERQNSRMSKITNDGLTRSGTGCFIAVPIW